MTFYREINIRKKSDATTAYLLMKSMSKQTFDEMVIDLVKQPYNETSFS